MSRRIVKRKVTPPSAPVLAAALTVDQNSLDVVLQTPSVGTLPIASYSLDRSTNQSTWVAVASGLQIFGADATYPDTGLVSETTYYYRCRATDTSNRVSPYGYTSGYTSLPPNSAPVWSAGWSLTITAGGSQSIADYASDPNGDSLTFSRIGGTAPAGVTVSQSGLIEIEPGTEAGSYTLGLRVSDGALTASTTCDLTVQAVAPAGEVYLDTRFLGLDPGTYDTDTARRGFRGTDSVTGQVFSSTSPQLWSTPANPYQYFEPSLQFIDSSFQTVWPTSDFSVEHGSAVGGLKITALSTVTYPRQAAYQITSTKGWQNQGMFYIRLKMRIANMPNLGGDGYFVIAEIKHNTADGPKIELVMKYEGGWFLTLGAWTGGITNHPWKATTFTPVIAASPPQTSFYATSDGQARYYSRGVAKLQGGYTGATSAGVNDGAFASQSFSNWMMFELAGRTCDSSGNVCGLPSSSYGNGWVWAASGGGTSATELPVNGSGIQRFYIPAQTGLSNPAWVSSVGVPFSGALPGVSVLFPFNYYSNHGTPGVTLEVAHCEVRGDWPSDASPHPAGAV